MATTITKTVNTVSGGDFTTMQAAEDWFTTNYPDFTSADIAGVITCAGSSADTTPVVVSGLTTDTTRNFSIQQAASDAHGGVWSDTKYRLDITTTTTYATAIRFSEVKYATYQGLQLTGGASAGYINILVYFGAYGLSTGCKFSGCIVRAQNRGAPIYKAFFVGDYPSLAEVSNNIFYGVGFVNGDDSALIKQTNDNSGSYLKFYNNTLYRTDTLGLGVDVGTYADLKNNTIITGGGACYTGADATASSNNVSTDDTAPGSDSLINQVATDLMTSPSTGDFTLKAGSNAIEAGADLSAYFTTDITGATRSTWDIGAFAYIATSTVPTLSAPSFVGRIPSTTLAF
ncbi:MAG: hypothetical protein PF440_05060 [Thiomicrorhabdus sp.]|jgi:hypothetical protein|nr:hypothetical protein [Thiomicrorhabdus sp.]